MGFTDWMSVLVAGTLLISGNVVILMLLAEPDVVKLLVTTGGKLPTVKFKVELLIEMLPIGAAAVPIEPATEVRVMVPLVRLIELVPPPLMIVFADTVPPTFIIPLARMGVVPPGNSNPRTS